MSCALIAGLLLGGCTGDRAAQAAPVAVSWQRIATDSDRARLRRWRPAWIEGIAQARAAGGAAAFAADPTLYDFDRALPGAMPPAGNYRCRTVKLGSQRGRGPAFVPYGWFICRIGADGSFAKTGSQRPIGRLLPDTDARAVFLGTLMLPDEARPLEYGRDRNRDMAGLVERIGERRWRMVLPYPHFESVLDLIELVPA